MINQRIGTFIAELRREKNWTQEQLAEKLGVSNRSVSRWENGKTLPDLSLMYCICNVLGITIQELLNGAREEESVRRKDTVEFVLELADREKQEKKKCLNLWFSLGLVAILAAFPAAKWLTQLHVCILTVLGLALQGIGFIHNNRDYPLNPREKAVLAANAEEVRMRYADELIQFAKKTQNASLPQYRTAFLKITDMLTTGEYAVFSMVAEEFSVNGGPGIWHAGIAVTQNRIFLCGETISGRIMTRTVLNFYDKDEILSVKYANQSIFLKTAQHTVRIRGEKMEQLAQAFQNAVTN